MIFVAFLLVSTFPDPVELAKGLEYDDESGSHVPILDAFVALISTVHSLSVGTLLPVKQGSLVVFFVGILSDPIFHEFSDTPVILASHPGKLSPATGMEGLNSLIRPHW